MVEFMVGGVLGFVVGVATGATFASFLIGAWESAKRALLNRRQ